MTQELEPDPLAFGRALVAAGVPVLACPPGGTAEGFQLPRGWQGLPADPRRLDVWRPGWALIAVCGTQEDGFLPGGVDVIDLDPRNGGTLASLRAAMGDVSLPPVVAMVSTPSGGIHLYVPAQGLGKGAIAPGVDYQAGTGLQADGRTDRGFVWIPPTVRTPKTGPRAGEPTGYGLKMMLDPVRLRAPQSPAFKQWALAQRQASASPKPDKGPLSAPEGPVRAGGRDNDATAYAASLRRRGATWEEAQVLQEARWRTY